MCGSPRGGWSTRSGARSPGRAREEREAIASADSPEVADRDDSLTLLLLCCHPALTVPSQVALHPRAVGGPDHRAGRARVPRSGVDDGPADQPGQEGHRERGGATFELPAPDELDDRVRAVMHVLYLVFTEGHTSKAGGGLTNEELAARIWAGSPAPRGPS